MFRLGGVTVSGSRCTAYVEGYALVNGTVTYVSGEPVVCSQRTEFRAVVTQSGGTQLVLAYVNGVLESLVTATSAQLGAAGQPGLGVSSVPAGDSVVEGDLGPWDNVAPNPVNGSSASATAFPNEVDISFAGTTDNPGGTGVSSYSFFRNGQWIGNNLTAYFRDTTVQPGQTYQYSIQAYDYHWNFAGVNLPTVTTPPAGAQNPKRVGVNVLGTYWGAQGQESIDVRSGNLNYALPLLAGKTRGLSVPLSLAYNSQNWQQTGTSTWLLGADVGYGFGWQMLIGSLLPVYQQIAAGGAPAYYLFTDSTGAQYRLDQDNNGVWRSKAGVYMAFDENAGILHFPNGTRWFFGCVSAGTEPDAGTMYPTMVEDSNGNEVSIQYLNGGGVTWNNSSARIDDIVDVRAPWPASLSQVTYQFHYNTDVIPHLVSIVNSIGTAENYTFA